MRINKIGIIGIGIMGKNLALNIESKGYEVSIYNRSKEKTEQIISENKNKKLIPFFNIKDFLFSLGKPKCVIIMIKSGKPVDEIINKLKPFMEKKDILIDGGNSFYKDTIRRNLQLYKEKEIYFLGVGISGGANGALNGPSIMPGGQKKAYDIMYPIFKKISASYNNEPCVTYIGPNGSGHYVKMIHNAIEYGNMQLISEAYAILKNTLHLNNKGLSNIFNLWNKGELKSYLVKITSNILSKKYKNKGYLIDHIDDKADNKNTGKWASQDALDIEESFSLTTESVFMRFISSIKNQRKLASNKLKKPLKNKKDNFVSKEKEIIKKIQKSLYFGIIISYTQGLSLLNKASKINNWSLNIKNIIKIFRQGCIISSSILKKIIHAYEQNISINNLLIDDYFSSITSLYQQDIRKITSMAIKQGIPIPALLSSITYYDSYRSISLSTNLIQAQRAYFGNHSYQIVNKPNKYYNKL